MGGVLEEVLEQAELGGAERHYLASTLHLMPDGVHFEISIDKGFTGKPRTNPAQHRPDTLIVADAVPAPSSETLGYAAHLLNCKLPDVQPYSRIATQLSPMARSFWSENRRASNRLLCQGLGYRLRFPSYREGYRDCLVGEEGDSGGGARKGTPSS